MATMTSNRKAALKQAKIYYDGVVGSGNGEESDISRADGVRRDPERVKRLMRSLSRHQGTSASHDTIYQDMANNDDSTLNRDTISSYIAALKLIFVVEDMTAWNPALRSKTAIRTSDTRYFVDPSIAVAALRIWNPALRSKTAIRTSDTRYFVDPSIAVAALRIGPQDLINDLATFGLFFETMAVRDLRVYTDALDGNVYHYRDRNELECDAVIHLENGKYGLVEIKLGGTDNIEKGATTLKQLARKIDTTKMPAPSFLMVLIGVGKYAYRRDDGVYVVPIGCLKP